MDTVPVLRRSDIETKAEEVLGWFDLSILEQPTLTPLVSMAKRLSSEFGVRFEFNESLGKTSRGKQILGSCQFRPQIIRVDSALASVSKIPRFNFTLAHELGHLVLHRRLPLDFKELDSPVGQIADDSQSLYFGRKKPFTNRERLEWQANAFASSLLLPRATVREQIISVQRQLGINRRQGTIFLDNQPDNQLTYEKVLSQMQLTYQVSKTVINIRLRHLKLVEDHRKYSLRHVSQLFREE